MPDDYELTGGDPNRCTGFSEVYPDRVKSLEEKRARREAQRVPQAERKVFSRKRAAAYLATSLSTLDRLIAAGEIPLYRVGKSVRFLKNELDMWIAERRQVPEGWDGEIERRNFIQNEEFIRLAEIHTQRDELRPIAKAAYEALESGTLSPEEQEKTQKIFDAAVRESGELMKEAYAITQQQEERLAEAG